MRHCVRHCILFSSEEIRNLFAEKAMIGARKISVDRRICLLEERVAALEAAVRRLTAGLPS